MEFLEGETLKELVARRGPIPAEELLDLMRPVVAAVGTMHRAGILHRDVSPDNVMVLKDGGVKLMDFGCARELEGGRKIYGRDLVRIPSVGWFADAVGKLIQGRIQAL